MTSQKRYKSLAFCSAILFVTTNTALAQTHTITSPRPVEEIVDLVSKKYRIPISYEDTNYSSSIDLSPLTSPQNTGISEGALGLRDQRVVLSRIISDKPVAGDSLTSDIQNGVTEYNKNRGYEAFSVFQDSFGIHVVSRSALDKAGYVSPVLPILDNRISLHLESRSANFAILSIQKQLRARNIDLHIGSLPLNILSNNVDVALDNVPARQALEAILVSVHYKGTWRLLCGPTSDGCALNLISY